MLELYKNIRKYRQDLKMSQDELARKAGYTDRSSIAKIEKGLVDLPQSKIRLFAEILGVVPGELMGLDGTTPVMSVAEYYGLPSDHYSEEEKQIIRKYRALSDGEKDMVCKMLDVKRK